MTPRTGSLQGLQSLEVNRKGLRSIARLGIEAGGGDEESRFFQPTEGSSHRRLRAEGELRVPPLQVEADPATPLPDERTAAIRHPVSHLLEGDRLVEADQ